MVYHRGLVRQLDLSDNIQESNCQTRWPRGYCSVCLPSAAEKTPHLLMQARWHTQYLSKVNHAILSAQLPELEMSRLGTQMRFSAGSGCASRIQLGHHPSPLGSFCVYCSPCPAHMPGLASNKTQPSQSLPQHTHSQLSSTGPLSRGLCAHYRARATCHHPQENQPTACPHLSIPSINVTHTRKSFHGRHNSLNAASPNPSSSIPMHPQCYIPDTTYLDLPIFLPSVTPGTSNATSQNYS